MFVLDSMDAKFEAIPGGRRQVRGDGTRSSMRGSNIDAKFEAMDEKFESLAERFGTQTRYTFLVLALIAALGLYNAAAPHFIGKQPGTVATAGSAPPS